MGHKQLRSGQLIAPFGPGSLYTDRKGIPHIVCGLDFWYRREGDGGTTAACEKIDEFELFEPRLVRLLKVDRLRSPMPYRHVRRGKTPPSNAGLYTPAHRFPGWYRHSKTGSLKRFALHSPRVDRASDGGRWLPVRFIAVCAKGHLSEFPWKKWVGCTCADDKGLVLHDRGGSELSSITVQCTACKAKPVSLERVTQRPDPRVMDAKSEFAKQGIECPGTKPWLGEGVRDACSEQLVGALINQTNLYFPRTLSAILLPELSTVDPEVASVRAILGADTSMLVSARLMMDLGMPDGAVAVAMQSLAKTGHAADRSIVEEALRGLIDPKGAPADECDVPARPEGELLGFRRSEYNVLRRRVDETSGMTDLRVIPTEVPSVLSKWLGKVHLVERLKETRAFFGFDRLEPTGSPLTEMPDTAFEQLFRTPPRRQGDRWLPAIEVFGEGLYLELREEMISAWQKSNGAWLKERLDEAFIGRVANRFQTLAPSPAAVDWASRYLLVHSLAHALIHQLVFECGYGTASLRERLYVSSDPVAPMAGLLIYTAAGDSDGTLGGLVRLGQPRHLGPVFRRAIARASWCSADPVCSEDLGGRGSQLANLGACHACILLPETSCETINHGLDRALLVGTPDDRVRGAFHELVQSVEVGS